MNKKKKKYIFIFIKIKNNKTNKKLLYYYIHHTFIIFLGRISSNHLYSYILLQSHLFLPS